ncbi:hypothetical protein QRZ34_28910 [Klebsiella michiganensis]|uniref:hypothetical protein n=1 Tax=Klebsiella michiganensis TaxID=1134687 RepID=UPI00256FC180|nr:hypothetical protein [Klebsiella michiganensis]MDL4455008.1 hypothetical protein [Klebsiella michiganensis]
MKGRLRHGGLWLAALLLRRPAWATPEAGGLAQLDALAQRDSDIPALLNYAQESWARAPVPALPREPAARKPVQAADKAAARLMKTVREQQATLGRQADTTAQLTASLDALKVKAAQAAASPALQAENARHSADLAAQAAEVARLTAGVKAAEARAGQRQGDWQAQARLTAELKTLSPQQAAERQQLAAADPGACCAR